MSTDFSNVSALADSLQTLSLGKNALLGTFVFDGETTDLKGEGTKQLLLKEVQYVYTITQNALKAFVDQNLEAFDPLVSDTACQIRARMITGFAEKYLSDSGFQKEVTTLLDTLSTKAQEMATRAQKVTSHKEKVARKSFYEFLKKEHFELDVSEEVVLLTSAHLLTKSKEVRAVKTACLHPDCQAEVLHDVERTNNKLIDNQGLLSVKGTEAYVLQGKRRLAASSCRAVQQVAKASSDAMTQEALKEIRLVEKRNQLPAYYTLKAVFENFLTTNTPLFVMVVNAPHTVDGGKRDPGLVNLFMKPDSTRRDFFIVKPTAEDTLRPAVFIKGQRSGSEVKDEPVQDFVQRFSKVSFMSIVKTFAAAHPQFTDKEAVESIPLFADCENNALVKEERDLVLQQRREADALGTSMKCQHLFTLVHMSATTLKAQKAEGRVVYEPAWPAESS
jgi:hypothetical protein